MKTAKRALDALFQRIEELETAIKLHRDQRGDDRCWLDDLALYKVIGDESSTELPPKEKFLENCARFYDNRCQNGEWKSYQELEEENKGLRAELIKSKMPLNEAGGL